MWTNTFTAQPIGDVVGTGTGPKITDASIVEPTGVPSASVPYASNQPFALTIPDLNIYDLIVSHPDDPFTKDGILEPLKVGVGHLFSYPGTGGKTMIYGHSSSYAWDLSEYTKIFRTVNQLDPGQRVYMTHNSKLYVYEVTHHSVIDAADISPFDDNGVEELILYTCWPPDSIAQRYLVHASPVETVALSQF